MASFVNYTNAQDPNYLGYSKGVDVPMGQSTLAKLFTGVSDTLDKGLKGATEALDIRIDRDAQAATDNSDVNLTPEDAATLGQFKNKVDTGTGTSILPEGGNQPAVPLEVSKGLTTLDKLYQRYQAGQLSPTYWLTQQQTIAQQLKSRYPGSEKEVDQALHRVTTPANAIRQQLFSDFQAAATHANTANKAWDSWVDKNSAILGDNGVKAARDPAIYSNRQAQTEIMARVAGQEKTIKDMQTRHIEMTNSQLQGTLDANQAERNLTLDLNAQVSSMMTGALSPLTGLQQNVDKALETGNFKPDDIPKWNATLTQMERAVDAQFDKHINARTIGDQSYSSLIKDPATVAKIKAAAKDNIIRLRDAINNDQTGLASYFGKKLERTKEYTASQIIENSAEARVIAGIQKAFGGDGALANQVLLSAKTGALVGIWSAAIDRLNAEKISGGKLGEETRGTPGSIAQASAKVEGKDPPPQVPKIELKNIDSILTNPAVPVETKANVVTYMVNDTDGKFFKQLSKDSQLQAFNTLTNNNIVQSVYKTGDADTWTKYKDWTQKVFNTQITARAGDIKQMASNPNLQLKYNPETNQLVWNTGPNAKLDVNYPELQTVMQINNSLRNMGTIYGQEKTDPAGNVYPVFKSMGIPIVQPTQGEENTTKAIPFAPVPTTPEAIQAINDSLRTNLEPGKDISHINNMHVELKSGLAAMIKDAPPEIKSGLEIFSGHRSEERQKQLFDAAVAKYGSEEAARRWVAPPGRSMHNTGKAADLRFASTDVREWVHANAAKYGLTFPLRNEPWHIEPLTARSK